jgi:hypothetical protein
MLHKGWGVCLIQVNDGIIDVIPYPLDVRAAFLGSNIGE